MCGIAGFILPHPDHLVLAQMLSVLRHRGPDDAGTCFDEHAALGHARLSIIDVAGGHQPMQNEDGSLTIVFNGEIFNYVELRESLLRRGHQFRTQSDTEVILHLFEEYGEDGVLQMNGQWAFAIWDRVKRSLFLSRDRMGVRPLFYTFIGGSLVFASEIKALLCYPGVTRELDLEGLDDIFTFWHTLPPRTVFRAISELPPGHSATFVRGTLSVRQYWDPTYDPAPPCEKAVEARYSEELLSLLTDATRIRLRSDVPVGAYLSGGIDSTVIAALARPFVNRMSTFSVRFAHPDLDEGPFQAEAVRHLGTEHREICCSDDRIADVFPQVIRHIEKPVVRTAPAPMYMLSSLVRNSGYKVVLTGEGADETLGGYDLFKEAKIRRFCAARPESRLRPLLYKSLYPYIAGLQSQTPACLNAFFHSTPRDVADPFFSHMPRWRITAKIKTLLSGDVKAALRGRDPLSCFRKLLPESFAQWSTFARAQYLEMRYLMPGYILSSQADRVCMAHSVEARFPFLDYRLVEFASRLPDRLKIRTLTEKYILKRMAANLVPPVILSRPKQPYRAPDGSCFFGPGRGEYAADLLSPQEIKDAGVFDPGAVQKLVEKADKGGLAGAGDNMAAVAIVSTQLFNRLFLTSCDSWSLL